MSDAEISGLLAIWSAVGIIAEVPSGAVADRFSRRGALVAAGVLQAAGYALWVLVPGFPGFAAGFVLWGLGGALISGAQEALLYDGLAAHGAQEHYALVQGRVTAAGLLGQLPVAAVATVLFAVGGYPLVGWASVGVCLGAAALAGRLPEPPRHAEPGTADEGAGGDLGYVATLRSALAEAASQPLLRAALLAAALVGGLDAIDEYFPIVTADLGVTVDVVPLAMVPITLAGALGAALGGMASRWRPWALGTAFGAAMVLFGVATLVRSPLALAGVAVFYGLYRIVLVVVDARLQDRIGGPSRATVTSAAGVGVEIAGLGLFAAWALGGGVLVAGLWLAVALVLPWLIRPRREPAGVSR
jgi:MFS family permease